MTRGFSKNSPTLELFEIIALDHQVVEIVEKVCGPQDADDFFVFGYEQAVVASHDDAVAGNVKGVVLLHELAFKRLLHKIFDLHAARTKVFQSPWRMTSCAWLFGPYKKPLSDFIDRCGFSA